MQTAVIFYFSGTGNTYWTSNTIASRLTEHGINTKSVSIESINSGDVAPIAQSADIIGFGYPIYGSDIPMPMRKFIENFPEQNTGKRAFVFCTQMMFSGDGSFVYRKQIESKSLTITQTAHINMPNNISMYPMIFRIPNQATIERTVKSGDKKALRFADAIASNKRFFNGRYSFLLGIMQRGPYRMAYDRFTDMLSVDKDLCTQCGRCVRLCPVGNISMPDGYPVFAGNCTQCLRCYSFCPVYAILVSGKAHNKKYRVYRGPAPSFSPEILKKNK